MSTERTTLFQETLQTSLAWIRELSDRLSPADEQQVYHLLCATLQALRDRLRVDEAVQLGAQLPVLIRGLYYEGWRPSQTPLRIRNREDFLAQVALHYHARPLADLAVGVRAALAVLNNNVSIGESISVVRTLPAELRDLWPEYVARAARADERRAAPG